MCGPQIQLCLFTFRPIVSKQLNSLTTIETLSCLAGAVVTHPLWVQEFPGSIPGSGKGFIIDFLFCCWWVLLFVQTSVTYFAIPFAVLIYLVYLTYCKSCGRLQGYKDTDLASLNL